LIEAKLTESDFQSAEKVVLTAYRDFPDVFDQEQLPQTDGRYLSYQLLRNVLAAYALECSFCVLVDARRPDLAGAWYAVMKCVKPVELRTKLRIRPGRSWRKRRHRAFERSWQRSTELGVNASSSRSFTRGAFWLKEAAQRNEKVLSNCRHPEIIPR
jgi:hypothetical protein